MDVELRLMRKTLEWSQSRMAKHLGVAQSTVCRMENGQVPSGPVLLLLRQLHQRQNLGEAR